MSTPGKEIAEVSTKNALAMRDTLREQTEIAGLLRDYIHVNMREGIDFGVIPGTKNPTLLQPGAERLAGLFRCIPTYKLTHRVEDYQEGIFQYDWSCELVSQDTGQVVATGIGSATSFESKWRYRNEARKCPACGKEAIIKGKAEYGGGWVCFKKKDGCGAKFADDDQAVVGQTVGRVENENPADLINTIQKIGKKRSGVDASAALARRYGYTFDVDMEDVKANDAARGGESNGHEQRPTEKPAPITTDTIERIIAGLAACNAKWDDILWRQWLGDNTGSRSATENAQLADLSEELGLRIIKLLLAELERRIQKKAEDEQAKRLAVPIDGPTLATLTEAFKSLNRTWEAARDKGWVSTVLGREVAPTMLMERLTQGEANKVIAEIDRILKNMKGKL